MSRSLGMMLNGCDSVSESLCSYAYKTNKHKHPILKIGAVCAASISSKPEGLQKLVFSLRNREPEGDRPLSRKDVKTQNKLLKYLMNESPFKDAFISKSVPHCVRSGVYMNVEHPSWPYVFAAAKVIRRTWERQHILRSYRELSKVSGLSKDMAFVSSFYFDYVEGKGFMPVAEGGGHAVFSMFSSKEALKDFLIKGPNQPRSQSSNSSLVTRTGFGETKNNPFSPANLKIRAKETKKGALFGKLYVLEKKDVINALIKLEKELRE